MSYSLSTKQAGRFFFFFIKNDIMMNMKSHDILNDYNMLVYISCIHFRSQIIYWEPVLFVVKITTKSVPEIWQQINSIDLAWVTPARIGK